MFTFPNFFYTEQSIIEHFNSSRLHIDRTENHFQEDKRIIYNSSTPAIQLNTDYVKYPTALVHHVSKPL